MVRNRKPRCRTGACRPRSCACRTTLALKDLGLDSSDWRLSCIDRLSTHARDKAAGHPGLRLSHACGRGRACCCGGPSLISTSTPLWPRPTRTLLLTSPSPSWPWPAVRPGGVTDPESYWTLLEREPRRRRSLPQPVGGTPRTLYDPDPEAIRARATPSRGRLCSSMSERFDAGFFGIAPREADRHGSTAARWCSRAPGKRSNSAGHACRTGLNGIGRRGCTWDLDGLRTTVPEAS